MSRGLRTRYRHGQISQALIAALALMPEFALAKQPESEQATPKEVDADGRFALADRETSAGHIADAVALYRLLEREPSTNVRYVARFRHSPLLMANSNFSGAAVLLRATLDEMPNWQRARLAFARALARMGREPSARRELRQAQVTPVPPVGGTVEIAFAPNSNVDRASAATLLSPEIQPFSLTRSAPVFSGSGLRISSQLYGYLPVTSRILATVKLTLNNHLYPTASYLVGANALTWHEFGKSTVFATFAVQHLMADGTLAPTKTVREDWLLRGGCGVALRKFTVFGFVPSIRASYTRNLSSIVSQPYSNPGGEFSLNHAF